MNLIWNKNISLFKTRFPSLAQMFSAEIRRFQDAAGSQNEQEQLYPFWQISAAKNGSPVISENGLRLHSAYNPENEAQKAVSTEKCREAEAAVFMGFGAGYTPAAFASYYTDRALIIIEPDTAHFFAALMILDWTPVFSAKNVTIALSCPSEQAITLITQYDISETVIFSVNAQTAHSQQYFETLHTLIKRNRQKDEINRATLNRFSKLWMRNSCRNLQFLMKLDGVNIYRGKAENKQLPFTLLAAGPSLEKILPHLKEIKKRSVIVCVDTALRACLRSGVEPDFIVLADPQYWAYRHIAGLSSASSVLITEMSAYPSVVRFPCRKIVYFSSFFPMGQYFEKKCGQKGSLGAGGSVASAAWNFAHLAGASEIFTAGLDLAFPDKKTHIRGSTFEQAVHISSLRTAPAETANLPALFSGNACYGKNYMHSDVLTDHRMKMFAWWFESRLAACPETKTYTFASEGLAIPGITAAVPETLLSRPEITSLKKQFIKESESHTGNTGYQPDLFKKAYSDFINSLHLLHDTAQHAIEMCRNNQLRELHETEAAGKACLREIADCIFPAGIRPEKLPAQQASCTDPDKIYLEQQSVRYSEICRRAEEYLQALNEK